MPSSCADIRYVLVLLSWGGLIICSTASCGALMYHCRPRESSNAEQMKQLAQQQQQVPQSQAQSQMMAQQTQQMQALEEQKRRYSMQLQQLQNQQNLQAQQQMNRQASLHQQLAAQQQQQLSMSRSTSITSQQAGGGGGGDPRRPSFRINAGTPLSQHSGGGERRPSFRVGGATTPLSPTNISMQRPPSRPNSQFSQASAHSVHSGLSSHSNSAPAGGQYHQGGSAGGGGGGTPTPSLGHQSPAPEYSVPHVNTFYNPVSVAKSSMSHRPPSAMARSPTNAASSSSSLQQQQHVAFNPNVSTYSQPSMPPSMPKQHQQPPSMALAASGAAAALAAPAPAQALSSQEQQAAAGGKSAGKKTAQRRHSHVHHTSTLTHEEVAALANSCTTEQKIVWVARQILGPGNANGFSRATSTLQRLKKARARSVRASQKDKDGGRAKDEASDEKSEEKLKRDTFNARLAKRMYSEMTQGIQFCHLMTDVIRGILQDIDPDNPVLHVQPPLIGFDGAEDTDLSLLSYPLPLPSSLAADSVGNWTPDDKAPSAKAAPATAPSSTAMTTSSATGIPVGMNSTNIPASPRAARKATASETSKDGCNPPNHGSTLRKNRKRGSSTAPVVDVDLLKMVGDHDDNGKKLSKKVSVPTQWHIWFTVFLVLFFSLTNNFSRVFRC